MGHMLATPKENLSGVLMQKYIYPSENPTIFQKSPTKFPSLTDITEKLSHVLLT
jgi:hypothetical protein